MNTNNKEDDYRSLLLLDEISKDESITQRELSSNLGTSLGFVNSYLKNLVNKGYITVSGIPRKRYRYYLTPKGFAEKTRLAYHHLQNFTSLYQVARRDFSLLFKHLEESGVKSIAFCGVDEVAEIAFLSLTSVEIELVAVFDNDKLGSDFFGHKIMSLSEVASIKLDRVVITSFKEGENLTAELLKNAIGEEKIINIRKDGWLERLAENN